jgi:uncharacterized phiE125 gp8 family phage protein
VETVEVVTPPVVEPVSLEAMRAHLEVEHHADDEKILEYTQAARRGVERDLAVACLPTVLRWTFDRWPAGPELVLPRAPVLAADAVASITYRDPAGVVQTLDPASYRVVPGMPGRVVLTESATWPTLTSRPGAVVVSFTAGWAAAGEIPPTILAALKLWTGTLYANRETLVIGVSVGEMPHGLKSLLNLERWSHGA